MRLVEAPTDVEYDLDHVTLCSPDPDPRGARSTSGYGFAAAPRRDSRRGRRRRSSSSSRAGRSRPSGRSSTTSAVLVDSAEGHRREAERLGIEVEQFVDAANTFAVFLRGPDGVRIEYVEQKPTFALA